MNVLAFMLGACAGVIVTMFGYQLIDNYLPDDEAGPCPPCNGKCNQGRDCPANR